MSTHKGGALVVTAIVLTTVAVGLLAERITARETPPAPADIGARMDARAELRAATFLPSLTEAEAVAKATAFVQEVWGVPNPESLPMRSTIATFTGLREDTSQAVQAVSDRKVWVVVFYDFPARARGPYGAKTYPTDPRLTVIVDDQTGNVIYSPLSWTP